jgi:hypothetical protein
MQGSPNILRIIITVLGSPIEGCQALLFNGFSVAKAMLLLVLGYLFTSLFAIAVVSQMYVLSNKTILFTAKIGLVGLLFVLMVGVLTYLVTKVSAEVSISRIMQVAGLCSIVTMVLVLFLLILLLLFKDSLLDTFVDGPLTITAPIMLFGMLFVYGLLHILNVVKQSFAASGLSSSASWYLSPLVVVGSFFITYSIGNVIVG